MTIFGTSVTAIGAGAVWSGAYITNGTEADGPIPFTISFEDVFGNAGDQVTGTTNSSLVNFDKTLPAITNITSGQLFTGDVTPIFTETNYSGTIVNYS